MLLGILETAGGVKEGVLGFFFGLLLAVVHFYLLEITLKWCFALTPKRGKFLVMLLYYLRFAALAGVLYLVLRLAGFTLALGIILGVMAWQLIWLAKNVKAFYSTKVPKDPTNHKNISRRRW